MTRPRIMLSVVWAASSIASNAASRTHRVWNTTTVYPAAELIALSVSARTAPLARLAEARSMPVRSSERVPQSKLQDSRLSRRQNSAEVPVVELGGRLSKVDLVPGVEELRAELHFAEPLGDRERFRERHIRCRVLGAT